MEFDDRDRESVVRDIQSDDEDVRRLAIERADALPLDQALPLLIDRLGDSSWRVRKAAVERLVSSVDPSAAASFVAGKRGPAAAYMRNGPPRTTQETPDTATPRRLKVSDLSLPQMRERTGPADATPDDPGRPCRLDRPGRHRP